MNLRFDSNCSWDIKKAECVPGSHLVQQCKYTFHVILPLYFVPWPHEALVRRCRSWNIKISITLLTLAGWSPWAPRGWTAVWFSGQQTPMYHEIASRESSYSSRSLHCDDSVLLGKHLSTQRHCSFNFLVYNSLISNSLGATSRTFFIIIQGVNNFCSCIHCYSNFHTDVGWPTKDSETIESAANFNLWALSFFDLIRKKTF